MAVVIPSWLRPADPVAAAQAGAGVGLQIRHQNQVEQSAADQLRLAQDELFERRQRAQESLAERRNEAAAKLAQASAQMALQAGHYEDAKKLQEASLALRGSHDKAMEANAKRRLDLMETQQTAGMNPDGTYTANPVNDIFGNQIGNKLPGMSGYHPKIQEKNIAATPSSASALLRAVEQRRKYGNASEEELANMDDMEKGAIGFLSGNVLPNRRPRVPLVTTNPATWGGGWFGVGSPQTTTTNYVEAPSAAQALEAPVVAPQALPDPDAAAAIRAIRLGAPEEKVKARYKERTGKDLEWPPKL